MEKAQDARAENDKGAMKDSANLLATNYIQDYMDKRYVQILDGFATTYTNAGLYSKAQFPNATEGGFTYAVSGDVLTVSDSKGNSVSGTILDNGNIDWSSTGNSGDTGNTGNNDGDDTGDNIVSTTRTVTVTSFESLNTDAQLPSDKNTIVQKGTGETQQQIVIPAGFIIASDSGTTIESGIVIEDAIEGNQFVWIPVNQVVTYSSEYNNSFTKINTGETATSGKIILGRYDFDAPEFYNEETGNQGDIIKRIVNVDGSDDGSLRKNVGDNSDEVTETSSNSAAINISDFREKTQEARGYYIGRFKAGIENNVTVCKEGVTAYNRIRRDNSITEARKMYANKQGYVSDLINGYAFDTAIVFIEKCGIKNNSSYYAYESATYINGEYQTGNDEQCNIYDMSVSQEWTTEYSNKGYTARGASGDNQYVCSYNNHPNNFGENCSFRPILYILEL